MFVSLTPAGGGAFMSQACPTLRCLLLLSPWNPEHPWTKCSLHLLSSAHSQPPWVVLLGGRAYLTLALTDVGGGSLSGKLAWVGHGLP